MAITGGYIREIAILTMKNNWNLILQQCTQVMYLCTPNLCLCLIKKCVLQLKLNNGFWISIVWETNQ